MSEPHYSAQHIEEHRAEFEEKQQWEAIERGRKASHEFLSGEHARINGLINQVTPVQDAEVFDYLAALEDDLSNLRRIWEEVERAFQNLERVHREQQRWKNMEQTQPKAKEATEQ